MKTYKEEARKTYYVPGGQYVRQQLDAQEPIYYSMEDFDYLKKRDS